MNSVFFYFAFAIVCHSSLSKLVSSRRKRDDGVIKVSSLKVAPYFMEVGPDRYEGYIVDLMSGISNITKQNYKLYPVPDGKYGVFENGKWLGLIGEVIYGRAEIAAAPMTVNEARKNVVNFTEPFATIDIVILLRKPAEGTVQVIHSAKDLLDHPEIKLIVIREGTTHSFFRTSIDNTYRKIGEMISEEETIANYEDGVKKVREGNYGLLMESQSADYWISRKPCDLVSVKIVGDERNYALATSNGASDLNRKLSAAIKQMKNDKTLDTLKAKWWKQECSGVAAVATTYQMVITMTTILFSFLVVLT